MSAALQTDPSEPTSPGSIQLDTTRLLQDVFRQTGQLSLEVTEAGAELQSAASSLDRQADRLHKVVASTQRMANTNASITTTLTQTSTDAARVRTALSGSVSTMVSHLDKAQGNLRGLSVSAEIIVSELGEASSELVRLQQSGAQIQNIAREIQLLAVNAGVEAARHGVAGRGFAVIAEAVKKLADQTRSATSQSQRYLVRLTELLTDLETKSRANLSSAQDADQSGVVIQDESRALTALVRDTERMISDIEGLAPQLINNTRACTEVLSQISAVSESIDHANSHIHTVASRIDRVALTSQDVAGGVLGSGVATPISELVVRCQAAAREIAEAFEQALTDGKISISDLFDENYVPIPGTTPQQVSTRFLALTDALLPAIQEPLLLADRRITFCAAVDRNGYLPTHNRIFSKPQGPDPEWNAQNCRNRRMFQDQTGIRSARNKKPILLQTYRRDMGGGRFVMMQDLSSPIMCRGRHWGAFRIGFRI